MRRQVLFSILWGLLFTIFIPAQSNAIESDLGITQKWSGDFDGMAERYLIRALVPPARRFTFWTVLTSAA
jgi:hypothetical protein